MICREVLPILSAYVDGELQASDVALLEAHLAQCNSCTKVVEQLKQLTSALSSTTEIEPPAFLLAQIESATIDRRTVGDKLRRTIGRVQFTPRYARLTAAMATVVLLAGVLMSGSVMRHSPQVSTIAVRPEMHSATATSPTADTGLPAVSIEDTTSPLPKTQVVIASNQDIHSVVVHHRHRRYRVTRHTGNVSQLVVSKAGRESAAPSYDQHSTQPWAKMEMPTTEVYSESSAANTGDTVARAGTKDEDKIILVASAARSLNLQEDPSELEKLRTKLRNRLEDEQRLSSGMKIPISIASIRF